MKTLFGKHGEKILMAVLLVLTAAIIVCDCYATFGNKETEPATGIGREVVVPDAPSEPEETPEPSTALVSLGSFKLTAYCPCPSCCGVWAHNRPTDAHGNETVYTASGEIAREGKTLKTAEVQSKKTELTYIWLTTRTRLSLVSSTQRYM